MKLLALKDNQKQGHESNVAATQSLDPGKQDEERAYWSSEWTIYETDDNLRKPLDFPFKKR